MKIRTEEEWKLRARLIKKDATPIVGALTGVISYSKKDTYKFFDQNCLGVVHRCSIEDDNLYFYDNFSFEQFKDRYY